MKEDESGWQVYGLRAKSKESNFLRFQIRLITLHLINRPQMIHFQLSIHKFLIPFMTSYDLNETYTISNNLYMTSNTENKVLRS
jgi:hypothetical protein